MLIQREDRCGIAFLRMERGKVNALDVELLKEFSSLLDELETSSVEAVVLTGAGPVFSAGVDLLRLVNEGPEYVRELLFLFETTIRRLFAFPKPTVAAVNGHAIAGGYFLMAACDRRIMALGGGKVGVPELLVGVPFPPITFEILRAVNPNLVRSLVYTGRTFLAEEALCLGVVDDTAAPAGLCDRAYEEARRLASIPSQTFRIVKREFIGPAIERAARLDSELGAEVLAVWEDPDTAVGIRAYLARTIGKSR